jgi:dsRNA-specific ribonuclease
MATILAFKRSSDPKSATVYASRINDNIRITELLLHTPLGEWFKRLTAEGSFRDAAQTGPVVASLNALLGAVFVRYGWEGCRHLEALFFSGVTQTSPESRQPARARLQARLQAALKDNFTDLFRIEHTFLNAPNESHNPRIEVTVFLAGSAIGKGVAGRKKDAVESACAQALESPKLTELLLTIGDKQTGEASK